MKTAVHTLLASAPALTPISADLRRSTVTFAWPTNQLVQRGPYVVLPVADAQQALESAGPAHVLQATVGRARARFLRSMDDLTFEVTADNYEATIYRRRPENGRQDYWWGTERRMDESGRWWWSYFPHMVMDDFGDLVALPEVFQ